MADLGWVIAFCAPHLSLRHSPDCHEHPVLPKRVRQSDGGRAMRLLVGKSGRSPEIGLAAGCAVVFDGLLRNEADLRSRLAGQLGTDPSGAEVVAAAYAAWGEQAFSNLKGEFSVCIWDCRKRAMVCARDQTGVRPLFYAVTQEAIFVAPGIRSLLAQAGVSLDLNRAGLVEHLVHRWTRIEETYFSDVRRVPPGEFLFFGEGGARNQRYWLPIASRQDIDWIPAGEARERFLLVLRDAVASQMGSRATGVFLSGGIDSAAIAMLAADVSRRAGYLPPFALSVTHDAPYDEGPTQSAVAFELGMERIRVPYAIVPASGGFFGAAIALSKTLPSPLTNFRAPAFVRLANLAGGAGVRCVLTGAGGDEWIGATPHLAPNMLWPLDLPGMLRLAGLLSRSYPTARWASMQGVAWQFGWRPILANLSRSAVAHATAKLPWIAESNTWTRMRESRAVRYLPATWMAPDRNLRQLVIQRLENDMARRIDMPGSEEAYRSFVNAASVDTANLFRMEENHVIGGLTKVQVRDPFWDPGLIEYSARVHPCVKNRGGSSKALVRDALASRFAGLGFDTQSKGIALGGFFDEANAADVAACTADLAEGWKLAEIGVVDQARLNTFLAQPIHRIGWRLWDLLNVENWVRANS